MLTKALTAAAQWSEPILVPDGSRLQYQVHETTAPFVAAISIQQILDISEPSPPNTNSTSWKTAKKFDISSDAIGSILDYGGGWFRIGINTGDYTGGQGLATLKIANL